MYLRFIRLELQIPVTEFGVSNVQVVEHPDAIKTVLVRWNGTKIDLTKLV